MINSRTGEYPLLILGCRNNHFGREEKGLDSEESSTLSGSYLGT